MHAPQAAATSTGVSLISLVSFFVKITIGSSVGDASIKFIYLFVNISFFLFGFCRKRKNKLKFILDIKLKVKLN